MNFTGTMQKDIEQWTPIATEACMALSPEFRTTYSKLIDALTTQMEETDASTSKDVLFQGIIQGTESIFNDKYEDKEDPNYYAAVAAIRYFMDIT